MIVFWYTMLNQFAFKRPESSIPAGSPDPNRVRRLGVIASTVAVLAFSACSDEKPQTAENPAKGGTGNAGDTGQSGASAGDTSGGTSSAGTSSEVAGSGGISAGAGGAETAGSAGTPGGSAGQAGTGGAEPAPDKEPEGLRVTGESFTKRIARVPDNGHIGGTTLWDTCPEDAVLIGFQHTYFTDFISGMQPFCGKLKLTGSAGAWLVEVDAPLGSEIKLQQRGGREALGGSEAVYCPPNQVLVGFEGKYNDWIRSLTLSCAPLTVSGTLGSYKLEVGAAIKLEPHGKPSPPQRPETTFAYTQCPLGAVARGTRMDAGSRLEAFNLSCGFPVLTHPEGTSCGANVSCSSAVCASGTCAAQTACAAPPGCSCDQFAAKPYLMCSSATAKTWDAAQATCAEQNMHLVHIETAVENGWLRSAADRAGIFEALWFGATDQNSQDNWKWTNGVQVPFAFQELSGAETLWKEKEPQDALLDTLNTYACGALTQVTGNMQEDRPGAWDDVSCADSRPFICEKN
jgi:hypothetical protein